MPFGGTTSRANAAFIPAHLTLFPNLQVEQPEEIARRLPPARQDAALPFVQFQSGVEASGMQVRISGRKGGGNRMTGSAVSPPSRGWRREKSSAEWIQLSGLFS